MVLVEQQAFLTLHSIHVPAVGCRFLSTICMCAFLSLCHFVTSPGLSPTRKTETSAWSARNPLATGKIHIVSKGDALEGQKLQVLQDQPPSIVRLDTSEAGRGTGAVSLEGDAAHAAGLV